MQPNRETRLKKYSESSEQIQNLYSSPESGDLLGSIAKKYNVADSNYASYALAVGDIILGFYPKTKLPQLLGDIGLTSDQAQGITQDLQQFLSPISSGNSQSNTPEQPQTTPTTSPVALPQRYMKPLTEMPRYDDRGRR